MLEKHVFLIVLSCRVVLPKGASRYPLRYRGERALGDPRARQRVTSPGVKYFLEQAILAHTFQSHFIGASEKLSLIHI